MRAALDVLVFGAFLGLETALRALPPRTAERLADRLGDAWYRLDRRRRHRARENLAVARRGGLEVADVEGLVRATFRSLMHVPLEMLVFGRYFPTARAAVRRCSFHGDWRRLGRDLAAGRGGLFVSGHLGSWELAAWVLRFLDVPGAVIARPIANPYVERRALAARGGPERVITKRGAVREVLRAVRRGGWIGILADQNAGARGAFVPFFGLPASTWATPAVLAGRTGAPLYAAAAIRRPGRPFTYEIHVRRLPVPDPGLGESERVHRRLAAFAAQLEAWVRRAPDQYNWIHRRWKAAPPGEAPDAGRPRYEGRPRPAQGPGGRPDREDAPPSP